MRVWRRAAWSIACWIALTTVACGSDSGQALDVFKTMERDPSFPGTPGDPSEHAALFQFEALPSCAVSNRTDLGVRTELRVFSGPEVTNSDVHAFLGGLQRYYSQYGVTMFTRYDVIDVPLSEALVFDMTALSARVQAETGIDLNRSTADLSQVQMDRATASLGRAIMYNVRELMRVYGEPRRNLVNVVLLDEMVSKNVPIQLAQFRGIAGLGLSPELLATVGPDDPAKALYEWLDASGDFTPMAIVGVSPVKLYLAEPDVAIAHEVGHAYGLTHVADPANLLHQGSTECSLQLDDSQLAVIRASAEAMD